MWNLRFIPFLMIAFIILSCSDDDDQILTPEVSYPQTTFDPTFYTSGNSSAPNISWNGNQGTFSLSKDINGLSINSTNGVISWTKLLPHGMHQLEVVVSNSAGQITIPIQINNPVEGRFVGTYSGSTYFAITFFEDGTADIEANSETSPTEASGTWDVVNDEIIVNYTYETTTEEYSVKGNITQTQSVAEFNGDWYFGFDAQNSPGGTVEIVIN
ncbi:hypothetical protein OO013_02455 [Mangrovivirga sp. M17]|uniref:Uncharacterized protein n=1 Tax=Mangrovivirga halotolerans TaxID=2993936 RepID=A0ABT3RM75_9BACT|nr:hypothetical protein [Mangrovivirga halotolerans]MCX2742707.1 hypothetical protein [Mangrovivirga halotolerans]